MFSDIVAYVPQFGFNEIAPFLLLIIGGLVVLGLDALLDLVIKGISNDRRDSLITLATIVTILVTMATFFGNILGVSSDPFLEGTLRTDEFGNLGALVILFGGLVFVAMAPPLIKRRKLPAGEFNALTLFALMGMVMLTVANELLTAFICIEILSLSLYVLVGIDRRSRKSSEGAFKYFILGAFASAFLVLGIAFLFGATGTTQLYGKAADTAQVLKAEREGTVYNLPTDRASYDLGMDQILASGERIVAVATPSTSVESGNLETSMTEKHITAPINPLWVYLGFAFVLVGICFKLSLAPFHMWAPDVYEGAPTITAMLIATSSKVAAFAFLVHLVESLSFWEYFPAAAMPLLGAIAVISILWGNIAALIQTNIKRMLAFSSIAHGGYIMVAIATLVSEASFFDFGHKDTVRTAIIFYLFGYTLMNVIAFGIAAYLDKNGDGEMRHYRGLAKRHPFAAAGMALTMISLLGLGIPGTIGFWGKYLLVKEAIRADLYLLSAVVIIGSAISAYYYLKLVVAMYMQPEEEVSAGVTPVTDSGLMASTIGARFSLALAAAMVILFGFFPLLFMALAG